MLRKTFESIMKMSSLSPNDAFIELCLHNEIEAVKLILEFIDVNYEDKQGRFALRIAAEKNFEKLCDILLDHPETDVNKADFVQVRSG